MSFKHSLFVKQIEEEVMGLGPYFLAMDVTSRLREKYLQNYDDKEVMHVLKYMKMAQSTGIRVHRRGANCSYMLFKRYGIPNPPDGWQYGDEVE
jgi:hypothetical protein